MQTANLNCWHRLKGNEADELVALAGSRRPARVPLTGKEVVAITDAAGFFCPAEERAASISGLRHGEAAHGTKRRVMACPTFGCRETYCYDDEENGPAGDYKRCAACGEVFHIEDQALEPAIDLEQPDPPQPALSGLSFWRQHG